MYIPLHAFIYLFICLSLSFSIHEIHTTVILCRTQALETLDRVSLYVAAIFVKMKLGTLLSHKFFIRSICLCYDLAYLFRCLFAGSRC